MLRTLAVRTRFAGKFSWAASTAAKTSAVRRAGVRGWTGAASVVRPVVPAAAKSVAAFPRGRGFGGPARSAPSTGPASLAVGTGTATFAGRPRLGGALAGPFAGWLAGSFAGSVSLLRVARAPVRCTGALAMFTALGVSAGGDDVTGCDGGTTLSSMVVSSFNS